MKKKTMFQSTNKQALEAIKKLQEKGKIKSVGTNRNYLAALKHIAKHTTGNLRDLTNDQATQYLVDRCIEVGQKSLDMSRQVMQHLLNQKLPVIKTEKKRKKATSDSRGGYTPEQVNFISEHQNERNALATKLAYAAGLWAHELLTLRPIKEQAPSIRPSDSLKFIHRDGQIYTVVGKGGLIREVLIPSKLARQLEQQKLNQPVRVTDRNIYYQQHYNVAGGQRWSNSFSKTSNRVLGWSRGGYGLRCTYAQERMKEITKIEYERALKTVSQEMGGFKPMR
jgi:hypothetical protein